MIHKGIEGEDQRDRNHQARDALYKTAGDGDQHLCELGEFEVITGDPFFGLSVEKGTISVPEGDGLGVSRRGF
jgi:hypothetical protein